jgi:hypothetical protein
MFFVLKSSPSSPSRFGYSHFSRSLTVPGIPISLVLPQFQVFPFLWFSHSSRYSHFSRSLTVPGIPGFLVLPRVLGIPISLVLPQLQVFPAFLSSHSPGFSGLSRSPGVLVGSQPCPKTYVFPSLTLGTGRLAQGGYPLKKPPIKIQLRHVL